MEADDQFWRGMRRLTSARIGIGRSGVAVPTHALLEFQLAFARARDAVHATLDVDALVDAAAPMPCLHVRSQASDRAAYLLRPDLGRSLSEDSAAMLAAHAPTDAFDLAFVIGDGLSAGAAQRHALGVVEACRAGLRDFTIAPLIIATQARVALADHVAELLGARAVMILLGERPGLTTAQSLGIYFSWQPRRGMADSGRNCISNVHDAGLSPEAASRLAIWLMREAARRKLSGVMLKEDAGSSAIESAAVTGVAKLAPPPTKG